MTFLSSYKFGNSPTNNSYGTLMMSSSGTYQITYSNNDTSNQIFLSNNGGSDWNILTGPPNFI